MVWNRLPRRRRRAALFALTALIAAKADLDARPTEPIIVVGCLRSASGLGESARLCYEALTAGGINVFGIDVSSVLMQPIDLPDYTYRDGRSVQGPGTLLVHVNAPLIPLVVLSLGRTTRNKWVVGYWAWELPIVPPDWKPASSFVHEVWVPSRFVAAAVAEQVNDIPVRVLAHPVGRAVAPAPKCRGRRPFTGLIMFNMASSMERKNPSAAIAAFRKAFGERSDSRIIVKVTNPDVFPQGESRLRTALKNMRNAILIDRTLPRSDIASLYAEADCLVSLHRSEGFGLHVAEAMLHGVPVLSTDWSGTTDFVTAENGHPVGYRLIPASDPQQTYDYPDLLWAEPNIEAAAESLWEIRKRGPELGERARLDALRRFSPHAYTASVARWLKLSSAFR